MPSSNPQRTIRVVDYDPAWPELFARLRGRIWPSVCDFAIGIEHVGSTAVPGLAAKPIIDLDIVIASREDLHLAITRLARLGYAHEGNLGVIDREAFANPPGDIDHHLYVCPSQRLALRNHLALRDYLRAHSADVAVYSALKKELAQRFPHDIDSYTEGKSSLILAMLAHQGLSPDSLDSIRSTSSNRSEGP